MGCFVIESILIYSEEFFVLEQQAREGFPTLSIRVLVLLCVFLSPAHEQSCSMDIDKDIDKDIEITLSAQLGLHFCFEVLASLYQDELSTRII